MTKGIGNAAQRLKHNMFYAIWKASEGDVPFRLYFKTHEDEREQLGERTFIEFILTKEVGLKSRMPDVRLRFPRKLAEVWTAKSTSAWWQDADGNHVDDDTEEKLKNRKKAWFEFANKLWTTLKDRLADDQMGEDEFIRIDWTFNHVLRTLGKSILHNIKSGHGAPWDRIEMDVTALPPSVRDEVGGDVSEPFAVIKDVYLAGEFPVPPEVTIEDEQAASHKSGIGEVQEVRLPKPEMDRFLDRSYDDKKAAWIWGKQKANDIMSMFKDELDAPISKAQIRLLPMGVSPKDAYQKAKANLKAGKNEIEVRFSVDGEGEDARTRVTLLIYLKILKKRSRGWIGKNKTAVQQIVDLYENEEGHKYGCQESGGTKNEVDNCDQIHFETDLGWVDAETAALVIERSEMEALARRFQDLISGVMTDSLDVKRRAYRNMNALFPAETQTESVDNANKPIIERMSVIRALLGAMATRPLVLLAGVSGSGKTQLAIRLGKARAYREMDTDDDVDRLVNGQIEKLIESGVIETFGEGAQWANVYDKFDSGVASQARNETHIGDEENEEHTPDKQNREPGDSPGDPEDDIDDADDDDADDDEDVEDLSIIQPDRFHLVPVRSDWKEASNLWGWYNPIEKAFFGTNATRLFIDAWRCEDTPTHVLVLDEMNLSRLEHYGSDLLSAMETPVDDRSADARLGDGGGSIRLHHVGKQVDMAGDEQMTVPSTIGWRKGIVVIGTVNVDETTFTFAPKVLDRAAVLEFVDIDLEVFFKGKECWKPLKGWFNAVQAATKPFNLHLGYRAADEIVRVVEVHLGKKARKWKESELKDLLDLQLRNKVLPRVRGPRATAEPVLVSLLALAIGGPDGWQDASPKVKQLQQSRWDDDKVAKELNLKEKKNFYESAAAIKARQMLDRLMGVGFTGYFG